MGMLRTASTYTWRMARLGADVSVSTTLREKTAKDAPISTRIPNGNELRTATPAFVNVSQNENA